MEHTPSIPKAPKCKEFLHKLLLGGLAYVPGASCGKPESLRGIQGDPLLRHGFCPGMVICKVWGLLDNHCENLDGKNDLYFVLSHAIEGSYYAIQMQHVVFYLEMQLESFPKSMPRNSLWDIKEVFKNHPERTGFSYFFSSISPRSGVGLGQQIIACSSSSIVLFGSLTGTKLETLENRNPSTLISRWWFQILFIFTPI